MIDGVGGGVRQSTVGERPLAQPVIKSDKMRVFRVQHVIEEGSGQE